MPNRSLTQQQLNELSTLQGNPTEYYLKLAEYGEAYGNLALQVVNDQTVNGSVARAFADRVAAEHGITLSSYQWDQISAQLTQSDFQARQEAFNSGLPSLDLSVSAIREYHRSVFANFGLPIDAWTAYVPLMLAGSGGDQALWDEMKVNGWLYQLGNGGLVAAQTAIIGQSAQSLATYIGAYAIGGVSAALLSVIIDWSAGSDPADFWMRNMVLNGAGFAGLVGNQVDPVRYSLSGGGEFIGGHGLPALPTSVAWFTAESPNDTLHGTAGNDQILGYSGNDTLEGGAGNDLLSGGADADILRGGAGDDVLVGGDQGPTGFFGAGQDTADYSHATSGIVVNIGGNLVLGGIPTIRVSNDGEGGHDLLVAIERVVGTDYSDRVVVTDLGAPELNNDFLSFNRFDKIDLGRTEAPALDDDMLDLSGAGRSITTSGPLGTTTANYGVRVDLRDPLNQTIQYLDNGALTSGTGGILTGLYAGLLGRSDVMLTTANANSVIGTQYNDVLIGNAGKKADGEGYSTLHGGGGNDFLAGRGWESHLFGDAGKDEFSVGSNTWIEDGEVGDTVDWGIRLTGGVNQSWQQSGYAYWAPFSSLSAAFPVIGSELIYTAAFFTDQVTMKFARYKLDSEGNLLINLWGETASAVVKNYNLDLTSGVGTAGITVFSSGHGAGTSTLGRPSSSADLQRFINLALKAGFGVGYGSFDPLILDLDGDGYNLTSEGASKAYFEFDSDGFAEHTGWLRATDGFLVRDANANGKIDNVTEMFGNQSTPGLAALSAYDSNADGRIDANDSGFASLQVWQDADQDGVTDAGELKTLSQLGIASISLASTTPAAGTNVAGNAILHEGSFTRTDGTTGKLADVALSINETDSQYLGDSTISTVAAALPQLAGFGEVKDLRVAMSTDGTLAGQVAAFVANTTNDLGILKTGAESILYRWAGVDGAAATALGSNGLDTRKLAFLEKYSGYQLMQRGTGGAIDLGNLAQVEALWADQVTRLTLRLVVQGPLAEEFSTLHYDAARDLMIANSPTALADLLHTRLLALPSTAIEAQAEWAVWAPLLGALSSGMIRSDANPVTSDYLFAQLVRAADGVGQPLSLAQLAADLNIHDVRIGTSASETLTRGTAGETAIYFGGGGNDVLTGGTGQDVYVFGREIGHTTINDNEPNPAGDRIRFAFLNQNDVSLVRDGVDLLITVIASGETVRVTGQFADVVPLGSDLLLSSDKGVEDIQFADGSIMEIPEIMAAVGKGSDGDDHLVGTMHSDVLTGGKGNDLVEGGDDADLYVFNRGDGDDIIRDQQTTPLLKSGDLLIFGDDIAPEDLTYSRSGAHGDDLLITVGNGGGSMLVQGQFAYTSLGYNGFLAPNSRIEFFAFRHYGDSFAIKDLQQQLIGQATTSGADTTRGFGDDDVFAASAGNDVLIGMDGADTYAWGAGAGNDVISEQAQYIDVNVGLGGISLTVRADVVQFADGTDPSTLLFSRNYDNTDLVITNTATGETLAVAGQFNSFQTGVLGPQWFDRVEWFAFADGSAYSWKDVTAMVTTGSAGDDRLRGDILADRLVGGLGNDLLSGGGGGDTYVFNVGDGHDTVFDDNMTLIGDGFLTADQTIDTIELGAGIDPGDVTFVRNGNAITMVFGNAGDSITLQGQDDYIQTGVFGAIPTSRIEQVKFHDGTIWTWQEVNIRMIAAQTTSGDDVTDGFTLSDRFEKSAGDDLLRGGDSSDTYVFGVGAGHDTIRESVTNVLYGDDDSIEFDSTVAPADVTIARDHNDLVITLTSGDTLRVGAEFDLQTLYTWTDVENFRFADGTVWSKRDVQQMLLQSTSGDDHLVGFFSGDDLDGGTGNDILEGGDGDDTYHFDRGYGNDEIRENVTEVNAGDFDKVVFGPALLPEDLSISREANDLVLTVTATGETLRIAGQFNFASWFSWNDVELFTFANGTQWTDIDIATRLTGGTSGDDHLIGTFRSETLDGKEGNDLLEGGDGGDVYLFGRGYGHDEIRESLTDANLREDDEVRFGAGISLADLGFTRDGDKLIISINGTDDTLTLTGEFTVSYPYTWNDVERFTFADGSYITKEEIADIVLTGTPASEHILGFGSNDTLDGGAGDDVLEGDNGSDTYRFGIGDGHDTIIETLTDGRTSEFDTISFKDGVLPSDVTITREAQDVIFTLASGDSIRVQGQFNEGYNEFLSYNDVEQVVFADGTVWDKMEIARRSIHSTAGDDLMLGTWYAETFDGGAGNDTIRAGNENDLITGGLGNDSLEGDGGDDTYFYNLGDGDDVIQDYVYGGEGADRIVFGAGINPADIRFAYNPADYSEITISFAGAPGSIRLLNQWWDDAGVESFVFADGTIWDQAEISARFTAGQSTSGDDLIIGTPLGGSIDAGAGDDHVVTGSGVDVITGGTGDDRLESDYGNDTYIYNPGDGDDVIRDYAYGGEQADRILFGAGIDPDDVTFANNPADTSEMIVSFTNRAGSIRVQNQWWGDAGIESFEFADGTVWNQAEIATRFVAAQISAGDDNIIGTPFGGPIDAGAGNDYVRTFNGDDVITGGLGNDRLESDYGNDSYIYNPGDGDDVIRDYSYGGDQADRILFGAGIDPDDVTFANNPADASEIIVRFTNGAGSIRIQNQWWGDAGIESFQFADGTVWDQAEIAARFVAAQSTSGDDNIFATSFGGPINAGAGNDVVHSGGADDILTGGTGDDRLESDYGNDRYIYNLGDGNDVIYDYSWGNDQADRIVFGAGIDPDDLIVSKGPNDADFKLSFKHADGSIVIQNQTWGDAGIEFIEFANGTVWTQSDINAHKSRATDGADTLLAASGGEEIWALGGNDRVTGSTGADALHGQAGNDVLMGAAGNDALDGGAGDDTLYGDQDPADGAVAIGDNLLVNGSFEQSGTIIGGGGWGNSNSDMPGWTKTNSQGYEQVYSGFAGIIATDGAFFLDMDAGGGAGSNMDISQTVTGLAAGDPLILKFDHANSTGGSSGAFEVYWNGTLLTTISQPGTTMTTTVIALTAVAGDNVLRFRAIGDAENSGGSLDNVRLHHAADLDYGAGDDVLTGGAGNDTIVGGGGNDVAHYAGARDDYQVSETGGVVTVTDLAPGVDGDDGTDTLSGVENVMFGDGTTLTFYTGNLAPEGLGIERAVPIAPAFVGAAQQESDGSYRLTPDSGGQLGALWNAVDLSHDVRWTVKIYSGAHDSDADGVTFALQNSGTSVSGKNGTLTDRSLGITFDTYSNDGEPSSDFSQIVLNGQYSTAFDAYHPHPNLEDGTWHDVVIDWDADSQTLGYSLNGTFVASKSYDLMALLGDGPAYFGFGATTGGYWGYQGVKIVSVQTVSDQVEVVENATAGALVGLLHGVDQNAGDSFTYAITNGDGVAVTDSNFEIVNGNELRVRAGANIDFETAATLGLFVKVTDDGGLSRVVPMTVNVGDLIEGNVAPTALQLTVAGNMPSSVTGSATQLAGDTYQLTPDGYFLAGAVKGDVDLSGDVTWTTRMFFGASDGGADGIDFSLVNSADASKSLGVHFDTYSNSGEPNSDFSQIVLNGTSSRGFDDFHLHPNLENNAWHDVVISWDAEAKTLRYSLDGQLVASRRYDVVNDVFGGSAMGSYRFSASTGGAANLHKVQLLAIDAAVDRLSVEESASQGALVARLHGVDPNGTDPLSYTITDATGVAVTDTNFEITSGSELRVKAGANLDGLGGSTLDLFVKISDGAGGSLVSPIHIDVEASAPAARFAAMAYVPEDSGVQSAWSTDEVFVAGDRHAPMFRDAGHDWVWPQYDEPRARMPISALYEHDPSAGMVPTQSASNVDAAANRLAEVAASVWTRSQIVNADGEQGLNDRREGISPFALASHWAGTQSSHI